MRGFLLLCAAAPGKYSIEVLLGIAPNGLRLWPTMQRHVAFVLCD
jgi:hypothetical protein